MIKELISIFRESPQSFEGQETGEKVVMILRKHIFVVFLALSGFFIACLVPILAFVIFYSYIVKGGYLGLFLFSSSLWYMLFWIAIFHFLTIYTLNVVIITDRRVIHRNQRGFFNQKVSELHAYRIQDVSTHTHGIIETVLRFGDVVVQTAASEKQFTFHQLPNPEKIKDTIMQMVANRHSGVSTELKSEKESD
jgi:hypothetical protein